MSTVPWWMVPLAGFGGAFVGVFITSLCVAAGNADRATERLRDAEDQDPDAEGHDLAAFGGCYQRPDTTAAEAAPTPPRR